MSDPTPTPTPEQVYKSLEVIQSYLDAAELIPEITAVDFFIIFFAGIFGGLLSFFLKVNGRHADIPCRDLTYLFSRQISFGVVWAVASFIVIANISLPGERDIGIAFFIVFVGSLSSDKLLTMFSHWLYKKAEKKTNEH